MQVLPERDQRNKAHKATGKRGKKAMAKATQATKRLRYCLRRARSKMMQQGTAHTPLPQASTRRQRDRLQIQPAACSFSSCSADCGVAWRATVN